MNVMSGRNEHDMLMYSKTPNAEKCISFIIYRLIFVFKIQAVVHGELLLPLASTVYQERSGRPTATTSPRFGGRFRIPADAQMSNYVTRRPSLHGRLAPYLAGIRLRLGRDHYDALPSATSNGFSTWMISA
jgi:hypothetical protein